MDRLFIKSQSITRLVVMHLSVSATLLTITSQLHGQVTGVEQQRLIELIENKHIEPVARDNAWSETIYQQTISAFNDYSIVLTKSDSTALEQYRFLLDDNFPQNSTSFFNDISNRHFRAIDDIKIILQNIDPKQVNFSENVSVGYCTENCTAKFIESENRKKALLTLIKYKTLSRFMQAENSAHIPSNELERLFIEQKDSLVSKVVEELQNYFASQSKSNHDFTDKAKETYFNAMCSAYDPHTVFFSSQSKDEFEIMLSDDYFTFGFELEKTNSIVTISRIIPGGPAWHSNEIHTGDQLVKLKREGSEWIDVSQTAPYDLHALLQSKQQQSISMVITTANGATKTVELTSTQSVNNDNIVKSFIFKDDHTIGYVSLPGFYTDLKSQTQLGCANDIAKELLKLKKSNIDGILLDLRNNGGGSLKEAIDLAGIFIDAGAMIIVEDNEHNLSTLKDFNRGAIYTGPVTVLVNKASASASEILAAILRDHNRALIVGTETFGKASGQELMPIDPASNTSDAIKITSFRLYRLDGSTYQRNGVNPDIDIPDPYFEHYPSEAELFNSLSPKQVTKKTYYTPSAPIKIADLQSLSKSRLSASSQFNELHKRSLTLRDQYQLVLTSAPLNYKQYIKQNKQLFGNMTAIDSLLSSAHQQFTIADNTYEEDLLKIEGEYQATHEKVKADLANDLILQEALLITNDYITQQKK